MLSIQKLLGFMFLLLFILPSSLAIGTCETTVRDWTYSVRVGGVSIPTLTEVDTGTDWSNTGNIVNIGSNTNPLSPICDYEGQVSLGIRTFSKSSDSSEDDCSLVNQLWDDWENIKNPANDVFWQDIPGYIISYETDKNDCECASADYTWTGNGGTFNCCGNNVGTEYLIQMNTFPIRETNGLLISYADNFACCDDSDDCSYDGTCYNLGEIITQNPRYLCGPNNYLREALDYNFEEFDGTGNLKESTVNYLINPEDYLFQTQKTPELYATDKISCNSVDGNVPQVWTTIDVCKDDTIPGHGEVEIEIVDSSGLQIKNAEVSVKFELYRPVVGLEYLTSKLFKVETQTTDDDGKILVKDLLGTYYTVIIDVKDGAFGLISPVRVNYDGLTKIQIDTVRTNACNGCVDYSNHGFCTAGCDGVSTNSDGLSVCDFSNPDFPVDSIKTSCNNIMPGFSVDVENIAGDVKRVECCSSPKAVDWVLGTKVPSVQAIVGCPDGQTLINKRTILYAAGEQITFVVSMCE